MLGFQLSQCGVISHTGWQRIPDRFSLEDRRVHNVGYVQNEAGMSWDCAVEVTIEESCHRLTVQLI